MLVHTSIRTRDIERSIDFYTRLLGLTLLRRREIPDRLFDHLAFQIKNMDETLSRMRSEQVTITDEPYRLSPTGGLIAFIEDPDGVLIELIERS